MTLLLLSIQLCSSLEIYCQEAVKSIKKVDICPTSKEEWDKAESKKNCSVIAALQNCTNTESFLYYCVIDRVRKETLELCAPKTIIRGHCPEFDYFSGIICRQESAECNRFTPKCDNMYNSSNAYESFDCYKLVCDYEFSNIPSKETTSDKTKFTVPVIATLACLTFVSFLTGTALYIKKCHNKPRQHQRSIEKEEANDYLKLDVDVTNSENELESEDLRPVEKETTKATLTTDDSTYSTKNVKELVEMFETTPFIVRINDTDKGSTTDRHAFAMSTSRERLCKENQEESSRYIRRFEEMDRYFVETKEFKEAEEIFHNYGIIIMTGLPGCGKTLAAVHLISKQLNSNWTFRKIKSREDLLFVGKNEKTLLLIDNMLLDRTTKLQFELWWEDVEWIYNEYIVHQPRARCARIVITTRKNVIKQACANRKNIGPVLNGVCLKDLSALTEKEKKNIFFKQIEFAQQVKKIEIKHIGEEITWNVEKGPIGFPLCAHLYVCQEEYRKLGTHFFSRPIEYFKVQIKDEIEGDKSNKTKSVFFVLFFQEWYAKSGNLYSLELKNESQCNFFLDNVSSDLRRHFGPLDFCNIESEAERLSGAFFTEVDEHTYTFFHDSVYEAVGAYFCETYVTETAKYFPLDIIGNQKYEHLTEKQQLTLITRLLYEVFDQRLNMVFACRVFHNKHFIESFCAELKQKDNKSVATFFTVSNESSTVKLPAMFWSSCNNLTYLTELLYDIAINQDIELDYQLYASLYGLCCARNLSMLQTINGMFQNNITALQNHVYNFRDSKGNCILHFLVASESSDRFVAVAVEKLANDGMVIDSKNDKSVTPLMLALEQTVPRTKVIETISRYSPKP